MIKITAEIRALIDKAAAGAELAEDEYIDPSDGLIHCKKCGGQRQTVVPCFGKSGYFMPRCICQCQQEAEEQRKAGRAERGGVDMVEDLVHGPAVFVLATYSPLSLAYCAVRPEPASCRPRCAYHTSGTAGT